MARKSAGCGTAWRGAARRGAALHSLSGLGPLGSVSGGGGGPGGGEGGEGCAAEDEAEAEEEEEAAAAGGKRAARTGKRRRAPTPVSSIADWRRRGQSSTRVRASASFSLAQSHAKE